MKIITQQLLLIVVISVFFYPNFPQSGATGPGEGGGISTEHQTHEHHPQPESEEEKHHREVKEKKEEMLSIAKIYSKKILDNEMTVSQLPNLSNFIKVKAASVKTKQQRYQVLGAGDDSLVYPCTFKIECNSKYGSETKVVVKHKQLKKKDGTDNNGILANEVDVMLELQDLAVARVYLYGRLTLNGHDGEAVVLEFLPVKISGILDKWFLREDQALALTYESNKIRGQINDRGILIRNFTLESVFFDENQNMKMAGFGSAKKEADIKPGDRFDFSLQYISPFFYGGDANYVYSYCDDDTSGLYFGMMAMYRDAKGVPWHYLKEPDMVQIKKLDFHKKVESAVGTIVDFNTFDGTIERLHLAFVLCAKSLTARFRGYRVASRACLNAYRNMKTDEEINELFGQIVGMIRVVV